MLSAQPNLSRSRLSILKFGISYDPDAVDYFAQATITDAAEKRNINNFILGIKALEINQSAWNNGRFYLLRSNQNHGSGTTVYGFGGLNSNNGTLNGSPTWNTDGIALAQSNSDYIDFGGFGSVFTSSGEVTFCSVHYVSNTGANRALETVQTSGPLIGGIWTTAGDGNAYWDCLQAGARVSGAWGGAVGSFDMWLSFGAQASVFGTQRSGSLIMSNTPADLTPVSNEMTFGFNSGFGPRFTGRAAFVAILATNLSSTLGSGFYSLYKSTVGQGLSLP